MGIHAMHAYLDVYLRGLFQKNTVTLIHGQYDMYLLWSVTRIGS